MTPLLFIAALWSWAPPATGSPPAYYVLDARKIDGTPLPLCSATSLDTTAAIDDTLWRYRLRVAAVDSLGRQGPWSEWSEEPTATLTLTVLFSRQQGATWTK